MGLGLGHGRRRARAAIADHGRGRRRGRAAGAQAQGRPTAREARPANGWLSERDLKDAHGDIAFALDVLVEVGQVKQDGFRYRITGAGVLAAEAA